MTDPIQSRTTPEPYDPTFPGQPGTGPVAAAPPGAKAGESQLDASIDKLLEGRPMAPAVKISYQRFIAAQTAPVLAYQADARTAAIQTRLDAFKQQLTPTYKLPDGSTVAVPAFFQMGPTGHQSPNLPANTPFRYDLARKLGVTDDFTTGRPSNLGSIAKMTQALIDAGKLGPPTGDSALRVRTMAWDFGLGIDCAGYVQNALYASQGGTREKYGLNSAPNENLLGLSSNPKWSKVGLADARPGDVLTLAVLVDEKNKVRDVGHAMIVYEHTNATQKQRQEYASKVGPDAAAVRVLMDPKLHVFQVDSSWGTGTTPMNGAGVQRRTWLYGESSGWLCEQGNGWLVASGEKPGGHILNGPFRPKEQP